MAYSLYDAAVTPCAQQLGALAGIIEKAAAHCAANKIEESALLQDRLCEGRLYGQARKGDSRHELAPSSKANLGGPWQGDVGHPWEVRVLGERRVPQRPASLCRDRPR
jgi:hypothetical protein